MSVKSIRNTLKTNGPIDFVILWVDGNDSVWQEERRQYLDNQQTQGSNESRYRDWDNLQYWFRGVQKYAPWVNRIFFITWGHVPKWLNTDHPKLNIIRHDDYIPEDFLPTYNSNVIELNLHRIELLSERFVLFNDDTFIINSLKDSDFFVKNKPRDRFVNDAIVPINGMIIPHTIVNNVDIINKEFLKADVIRNNPIKAFNWRYGTQNLRTLLLLPWKSFTGFKNDHLPASHLKSTFQKVWSRYPEVLSEVCTNRFRTKDDLNHWLMRYWNVCSGNYYPRHSSFGKYFNADQDLSRMTKYIEKQSGKIICINDVSTNYDFECVRSVINAELNKLFREPSRYELF